MSSESRRNFLSASGKLIVGTIALGSICAGATEDRMREGAGDGLIVRSATENTCATCEFWGGMRTISNDRRHVTAQSMGWCNNSDSPNHEKLTAADHQMLKPGIWRKWAAL
jgi:anaerobic selenocysteine-containing dehydrogenase